MITTDNPQIPRRPHELLYRLLFAEFHRHQATQFKITQIPFSTIIPISLLTMT